MMWPRTNPEVLFPERGRKTAQELSRMYREFERNLETWRAVVKWMGGGLSHMTGACGCVLDCYLIFLVCSHGTLVSSGVRAGEGLS